MVENLLWALVVTRATCFVYVLESRLLFVRDHEAPDGAEVRRRAVSGPVSGLPNPAEVKTGTFDPKTGALKRPLGKRGDSAVLLTLEGTVVNGKVTGRVSGEMPGDFKIETNASLGLSLPRAPARLAVTPRRGARRDPSEDPLVPSADGDAGPDAETTGFAAQPPDRSGPHARLDRQPTPRR